MKHSTVFEKDGRVRAFIYDDSFIKGWIEKYVAVPFESDIIYNFPKRGISQLVTDIQTVLSQTELCSTIFPAKNWNKKVTSELYRIYLKHLLSQLNKMLANWNNPCEYVQYYMLFE